MCVRASCSMVLTSVILLTNYVDPWMVLMSVVVAHVGYKFLFIAITIIYV